MWGKKLRKAIQSLGRKRYIDKKEVKEFVKEVRRSLASSDVKVKLNLELCDRTKERALKEKPLPGLTKKEQLINIVYEELTDLLGKEKPNISFNKQKILLTGLFGQGKTTSAAKLAKFFTKRGLSVGVASTDIHRPAAYEQLRQLCEENGIPIFDSKKYESADKIVIDFLKDFKDKDILIVDSAGRDMLDKNLEEEIKRVSKILSPDEKLLVLGADMGQSAGDFAEKFDQTIGLTGVLITKLDTTAKAGGALSAVNKTNTPVKFIGTGEKITDIEIFHPKKYIQRILGMGDLESLIEKVKESKMKTKIKDPKKILDEFNLEMFLDQINTFNQMGSFRKILPMMGMVDLPKDVFRIGEKKIKKWKAAIQSMTPEERKNPNIINSSRIRRIAKGSGMSSNDIRELLKQFKKTKKMMDTFKKGLKISPNNIQKLMKGL